MAQKTTEEFSYRLQQAVEGHHLAPPTPFGRQKWLMDKLAKEAKVKISPNTIHKWFNGTARPREDKIRALAKILSVDEVWLSLGRRPVADAADPREDAVKANGATLLLAGLIEMNGGRVTFPSKGDEGVSLWADLGKGSTGIVVVTGTQKGSTVSYVVPEPVGDNRIVSVTAGTRDEGCAHTGYFDMIDLTDAERQNFGGFSVIQGEVRKDGKVKVAGQRSLLAPAKAVEEVLA